MGINVSIGDAKVDYSTYSYTVWTDAVVPVATATADPSNPRIDRIVGYVDRSVTPSSVTTNNPGLLKFMSIAGTPSASPAAPSNVTVQAAVGASNPYFDIANILVGTGVTQITTGNITDTRVIVSINIPNSITNTSLAGSIDYSKLLNTIFSGQIQTYTNTGDGGGTGYYANIGGIKLCWGITGSITVLAGSTKTISMPVGFFTNVRAAFHDKYGNVSYSSQLGSQGTTTTLSIYISSGSGTMGINWFVIGT